MSTSLPWKRIERDARFKVKRAWSRTRDRFPPAESPARMILFAGTGSCNAPGGGWISDRYAVRASTSAAGNGFCGASLYLTERTGAPVKWDRCATGTRCVHGSIRLYTPSVYVENMFLRGAALTSMHHRGNTRWSYQTATPFAARRTSQPLIDQAEECSFPRHCGSQSIQPQQEQ